MCEGFLASKHKQELVSWRQARSLGWIIVCGYADPTKLPANMMEWWEIEGDVKPKSKTIRMTKAKVSKIAEMIKKQIGG